MVRAREGEKDSVRSDSFVAPTRTVHNELVRCCYYIAPRVALRDRVKERDMSGDEVPL